jgi:hypothetical protein
MRTFRIAIASLVCAAVGCHSAVISATISNRRPTPVTLIEVDYPSASFGIQNLNPGEDYHYRLKVIGKGPMTLHWSEPSRKDQKVSGPIVREGDDGTLTITFGPQTTPIWDTHLTNRSLPR